MRRKWSTFPGTVCMLGVLSVSGLVSQYAKGQTGDFSALNPLTNSDLNNVFGSNLYGSYAFQFTGALFLPAPPFDQKYIGPMYRNGIVVFDGRGNFKAIADVANNNGFVSRAAYPGIPFSGTYVSHNDGTFTLTIVNLPIPAIPAGTPDVFTFDGVLADNGRIAKLVLSAVSIGGQPQSNIGSVIAGELIKQ